MGIRESSPKYPDRLAGAGGSDLGQVVGEKCKV